MVRAAGRNAGEGGPGGRVRAHYNKKALKRVRDEVRPTGPLPLKQVAVRYKEFSGVSVLRDEKLLIKAWFERHFKPVKPQTVTGAGDFVIECQETQRDIMDTTEEENLFDDRGYLSRSNDDEREGYDLSEGRCAVQEDESNYNYEGEDMEDDEDNDSVENQATGMMERGIGMMGLNSTAGLLILSMQSLLMQIKTLREEKIRAEEERKRSEERLWRLVFVMLQRD
jgi:hypothetical protein